MTAENNIQKTTWAGVLLTFIPAVLGIAAAAALLSSEPEKLVSALTGHADGYTSVFASEYTVGTAFSRAVLISRADIAMCFIAMMFPYTVVCRPISALLSFLRTCAVTLAVTAVLTRAVSLSSALASISLIIGAVSLFFVLMRADSVYQSGQQHPNFRDTAGSVLLSAACSGAVITTRTVLLLLSGALL